jgi:hypothetical protein
MGAPMDFGDWEDPTKFEEAGVEPISDKQKKSS